MLKGTIKKSYVSLSLLLVFVLISSSLTFGGDGSSSSPFSVSEAKTYQNGSTKSVVGYVVGEPIATNTVKSSGFSNDYAIALADSSSESNTNNMIYVQVSSSFRSQFGLRSNPSLMGTKVKVVGKLTAYFSHDGVKSISSLEKVSSTTPDPDPDPDPDPNPDPGVGNYYKSAEGLSGAVLKQTLHNIIDNHTELSYSQLWDALRYTDKDPSNSGNVIEIYTGRSISKYSNGGSVNDWNREHVWAKSHGGFGTSRGAGTDLHHIRPADVSVNSSRSNLDFDNGGVYHSEATQCRYDSDSFEPRDAVKGDVARMIFYMAVRYEGDSGELDLELSNYVNNGSSPYHGKLSTLLQWHQQDPVDDWERNRNNVIYESYQGNRNPFIDHPEWVTSIWN